MNTKNIPGPSAKIPIERPDLCDQKSPKELRVVQLTGDPNMPCAHVYMEAQIFSPDSKRFLFERSGNAHDPVKNDPEHRYMLCNLEDQCRIIPITDELNAIAPSFGPDGQFIYYLVDNSLATAGTVELKRVRPDRSERERLCVISPETSHDFLLRFLYSLSTISSDGQRLATAACVIDRKSGEETWGIVVFDLEAGTPKIIWKDPALRNAHPQYCRSQQTELAHDLLIQHNHGYRWDTKTCLEITRQLDPLKIDIHLIRDDGTNLRSMPWGRDGKEFCQGHQCWRGMSHWAITSTQTYFPERMEAQLIETRPVPEAGHKGLNSPGAVRNDLSRAFPNPQFHHFGTDRSGTKMISDYWLKQNTHLYLIELGEAGREAAKRFQYLLDTKTSFQKQTQAHPFLSPDGKRAFFNSDETGIMQVYMLENLPF